MAASATKVVKAPLEAPKFTVLDAVMLLLALASVALVLTDVFWRQRLYEAGIFGQVVIADFVITLIFLGEFVWKLENRNKVLRVIRENWFDLLGMLPLAAFVLLEAHLQGVPFGAALTGEVPLTRGIAAAGLIRLLRFVRVVRIVQAFSRFLRATNMTFGEQVTKRFFDKYRRIVVMELTTPILVAGITVSQELIVRMKFLESAGQAIDSKRAEIHAAVIETLEKNKVPPDMLSKPFIERLVRDVETAVVDRIVVTLTGPEINKLTQEMIVEVLEQFKQQLTSPEGKELVRNMGSAAGAAAPTPDTMPAGAPRPR